MHNIKTIIQRCTAGAVLLITTLTFAFAASSSDIKAELDKAKANRETAHQLAENARYLGADEDNYVIWFAKQQWDNWDSKVKSLTVEYNKVVEEENNKGRYIGRFRVSRYCPCSTCNGGYTGTATGTTVTAGRTIAVDPSVIPLGSTVYIDGIGTRVAEDTGGAIKGNKVDLAVSNHSEAYAQGVTYHDVYIK